MALQSPITREILSKEAKRETAAQSISSEQDEGKFSLTTTDDTKQEVKFELIFDEGTGYGSRYIQLLSEGKLKIKYGVEYKKENFPDRYDDCRYPDGRVVKLSDDFSEFYDESKEGKYFAYQMTMDSTNSTTGTFGFLREEFGEAAIDIIELQKTS